MCKKRILLSVLLICCFIISCEKPSATNESAETLTSILNIPLTEVPTIMSTKAPEPSPTFTNDVNYEREKSIEVSRFQVVNVDDIIFLEDFDIPDYETIYADDTSIVTQSRGFFAEKLPIGIQLKTMGLYIFIFNF